MMGAEASELLKRVEVDSLSTELRENAQQTSLQKRLKYAKRLKVVSFPQERQQAELDDPRRDPGHSTGVASSGSTRRRPLRDLGLERSLSPRHQP